MKLLLHKVALLIVWSVVGLQTAAAAIAAADFEGNVDRVETTPVTLTPVTWMHR